MVSSKVGITALLPPNQRAAPRATRHNITLRRPYTRDQDTHNHRDSPSGGHQPPATQYRSRSSPLDTAQFGGERETLRCVRVCRDDVREHRRGQPYPDLSPSDRLREWHGHLRAKRRDHVYAPHAESPRRVDRRRAKWHIHVWLSHRGARR